ncbi:MAG: GDSL-type esterase/lipase family protein [Pseudomonadota bacterium]
MKAPPVAAFAAMVDGAAPKAAVLALGDSYTVGEGVPPAECWPAQLVSLLNQDLDRELPPPQILATTGWTTDELAAALAGEPGLGLVRDAGVPGTTFKLVFLSIGVNDQYRGRSLKRFQAGFAGLLTAAISLAGNDPARVIVVSIPDWSQTPFALSRGADRTKNGSAIDAYNAVKKTRSESAGVLFVDITTLTRGAAPDEYALDGLHPGSAIYQRWAQKLRGAAAAALAPSTHA